MSGPQEPAAGLTWSILIASLTRRQERFLGLLDVLLPQVEAVGQVEIVACPNDGEVSVGTIRQALLETARGIYVSFIDDDDMVPGDFVETIMKILTIDEPPDVIGFNVEMSEAGKPQEPCYCSITFSPHDDFMTGFWRDLTHVQPLRRELALLGDFRKGWPEDFTWRAAVRPHVQTEVYIDRFMYHYRHDQRDSVQVPWMGENLHQPRKPITSKAFRYLDVPQPAEYPAVPLQGWT